MARTKVQRIDRLAMQCRGYLEAAPLGRQALQKPLVNLLWLAGFVFVGGALIALWPDAREERRLAERYAGATVRA